MSSTLPTALHEASDPMQATSKWGLLRPAYGPKRLAIKNHFVAMIGEFVGTTLFILFCLGGTHVALLSATSITGDADAPLNTSSLFYIALSFGLSLTVNVWIFFRVSGGLFNPAVSLGMTLAGCLPPLRGALLAVAQILGGMTGAAIADALVPGHLNAGTALGGGASIAQGLFIEVFLTALLMLTIFFLAAEKHKATFMAPLGIGMALFIAEIVGVYFTGGSLNPARSFGPAVVTHDFPGYHWIYWVGPCLGASLAAGFYRFLKWLEYETVLGPEDPVEQRPLLSPSASQAPSSPVTTKSEQDAVSHNVAVQWATKGPGEMKVTGPGLGDLETDGTRENLHDLNQYPGRMNARLEKIEKLLAQLVETRRSGVETSPV
ncbi:aquaporin rerated protein, other eukaryote [Cryptococcus wingfieldii CBS 7118]|uniref:Aquaporin rerated protein, other eukaryote n=1 Tax=Cryptococcus wingfieldii CBS 7118 TaxID=1295528 RepID=A0A1E3K201_9TREE|nr:aquaporin rerated protein, other eukaryote [Cryptococcus wingfieldii CBS 7118]ODO07194.1 aquaporin rerated protein, other eukaryote [Cryptococcus wingfieldii CBS 7118]